MELEISWSKKDYGSGPGVSITRNLPDEVFENKAHLQAEMSAMFKECVIAVTDQLSRDRLLFGATRVVSEGDEGNPQEDDLRPGDPAYDRQRPPRGRDNRPPDNRTEERRREDFEARQRGYEEYIEETRPREQRQDDRPARYEDGGRRDDRQQPRRNGNGQGNGWKGGPPKTGVAFFKWYKLQSGDLQGRIDEFVRDENLPDRFSDWNDDTVADVLRAVGVSQGGGRRNGYAGSRNGSNGRGSY